MSNRRRVLGLTGLALVVGATLFAAACSDSAAAPIDTGEAGTVDDASSGDGDATSADANGGVDAGGTDAGTDASDSATVDADAGVSCVARLPGSFGSNACNKCVGTKCCGVLDTCTADQDCNGAMACNLPCFNEADSGGCFRTCIATTDGGNKYLAFQNCWLNNECGVPCFQ
jgi:hypothetical protein